MISRAINKNLARQKDSENINFSLNSLVTNRHIYH